MECCSQLWKAFHCNNLCSMLQDRPTVDANRMRQFLPVESERQDSPAASARRPASAINDEPADEREVGSPAGWGRTWSVDRRYRKL